MEHDGHKHKCFVSQETCDKNMKKEQYRKSVFILYHPFSQEKQSSKTKCYGDVLSHFNHRSH